MIDAKRGESELNTLSIDSLNEKSIIFFGVQSASLGNFFEVALTLNLRPIYVDNLPNKLLEPPKDTLGISQLQDFHFLLPIVISIMTPHARESATNHARELGFQNFPSLISPTANIANNAVIENGAFINAGAMIGPSALIAENSVINAAAMISHHVSIGEFTHVAPSACVLGSVIIEDRVFVGANSTILNNIKIGAGAIIGAGAVVLHDVLPGQTVVGNPARVIKG